MTADILNSGQNPSRWAVIVGVDRYPNPKNNLGGCCNDAVLVYNFLRDSLGTLERNILLHLSRAQPTPEGTPDPPSGRATYWAFRNSLEHVQDRAKPGDFVHIHFSGHGHSRPTARPHEKGEKAQDEMLCFYDREMPDYVLGEILDSMTAAPKHLIVLLTLDCCFSGGATRLGEEWAVRYKPEDDSAHPREHPYGIGAQNRSKLDQQPLSLRHGSLEKSWLYRDRAYNVIAACQPSEMSTEGPDGSGQRRGVLTSMLMQTLGDLGARRFTITYAVLQGLLEAKMKAKRKNQQPMLIGPQNRILFESLTYHESPIYTYVLNADRGTVVINKGNANGARQGDVYCLSDPRESLNNPDDSSSAGPSSLVDTIQVSITTVRDYDSDAKICQPAGSTIAQDQLQVVKSGWLAKLMRRTKMVYARVYHDETEASTSLVEALQGVSQSLLDLATPIALLFPNETEHWKEEVRSTFHVHVADGVIEVRDSEDHPFDHLPTVPADRSGIIPPILAAQRLVYTLQHMHSFTELLEMQSPSHPTARAPPLDFTATEYHLPEGSAAAVSSSWKFAFHNNSSRSLFITVFNMTPLHGVFQIMPGDEGYAKEVVPGEPMSFIVDVEVHEALEAQYREDALFVMRDVFKIFVTTEYTDLRGYLMGDLIGDTTPDPGYRHSKVRLQPTDSQASWWLLEKQIITRSHLAG